MMMTTTRKKNDFQGRAKQANFLIQVCIKNDRFRARVGGRRLRQGWPEKKSFLASRQKEPRQPPLQQQLQIQQLQPQTPPRC